MSAQTNDPLDQLQESVTQTIGAAIRMLVDFLLHGYELTFHAFLRRGFGEKKCQPFHVMAGTLCLIIAFQALPAGSPLADAPRGHAQPTTTFTAIEVVGSLLRLAYLGGFILLAVRRHGWPHWRRFVTDRFERNVSVSSGASVLRFLRPTWKEFHLKIFVEPIVVVVFAVPVFLIDKGLGMYLMFGSFALFFRAWITHGLWRDKIMSHIDRMIEGEFTARVLKQNIDDQGTPAEADQPSNDPWGNLVHTAFAKSGGKDISLTDMMANLDPKLQKIMTRPPKPEDLQPFRSPPTG